MDEIPDTIKLPCENKDGSPAFPIAVHHSCYEETISSITRLDSLCLQPDHFDPDQEEARRLERFVRMNRVCTAKPNKDQIFTCYEIAPETNLTTYFADYLEAVEMFDGCKAYQSNLRLRVVEESSLLRQDPTDDPNVRNFNIEFYPSTNNLDPDWKDYWGNQTSPYDPIMMGSLAIQTRLSHVGPLMDDSSPPGGTDSSPPGGTNTTTSGGSSNYQTSSFLVMTWISVGFSTMVAVFHVM